MRQVALALSTVTMLLTVGCSNLTQLTAKKGDTKGGSGDAKATLSDNTAGPATATGTVAGAAASGDGITQPGLPSYCQFKPDATSGKGCFTCSPRSLPITQCTTVPASFDPASACTHDFNQLSCEVGAAKPFVFVLDTPTQLENLYSKIPLLVLGAKALLANDFQNQPNTKDLVFGALDALDQEKTALFTGGDAGPFLDKIVALVQKDDPQVSAADLATIKQAGEAAIATLRLRLASGAPQPSDILTFAEQMLSTLPASVLGQKMQKLDLSKILGNLQSGGNGDLVNQLLQSLGTSSVNDIVTQLQTATGGSATGSATATAH